MAAARPTEQHWDLHVDVAVLGAGAAGSAAALEAQAAGASVVVLERQPAELAGGNTRVSGGAWFVNRDPERIAVYLRGLCAGYDLPDEVVTTWAHETALNTDWVRDVVGAEVSLIGEFPPEFAELDGSDGYGGYWGVEGRLGGGRLHAALVQALQAHDVDVRHETRAERLVQDPSTGDVVGVRAQSPDGTPLRVRARGGVVLATGGFESDVQMVRDYLRFPGTTNWGTPYATGDGHRMAQKVGADLWHMDNMMTMEGIRAPGRASGFLLQLLHSNGFLHVDATGRRAANELPRSGHGQAKVHGGYEHFPVRRTYCVFDERTRLAGPISPGRDVLPVGWNLVVEGYDWSSDNAVEVEKGWIVRGGTVEELAVAVGLDPAVLAHTVARYNAACAAGLDDQFGRHRKTLVPVDTGPYYAVVCEPLVAWSNGGPRRDADGRVLDPFGDEVAGLFAAGSVSSTFSWCKDGGFHLADALAVGRRAGRAAAARA